MNLLVTPHLLAGIAHAIPSKSVAHRTQILAAFSDGPSRVPRTFASESDDTKATWRCLRTLGCTLRHEHEGSYLMPVDADFLPVQVTLDVGESGSTLRFLLPVVAALGCKATFVCHGRLAERPLTPLDEQLAEHGATVCWTSDAEGTPCLKLSGKLTPGTFRLPGNVSSQYVSGLLLAAPLMVGTTEVVVQWPIESRGYIDLTIQELARHGVQVHEEQRDTDNGPATAFCVEEGSRLVSPGHLTEEGDWSNSAFWLAAGAIGPEILTVEGLSMHSRQGDRAIVDILGDFGAQVDVRELGRDYAQLSVHRGRLEGIEVDISDIPDLAAPIAAVAAVAKGTTRLTGAGRLRLKESDRLETIASAIRALGGHAEAWEDELAIEGVERLSGGVVDTANDHRIAMMAAMCAAYAEGPTTIVGAECVAKSYPAFFMDFSALGGIVRPIS